MPSLVYRGRITSGISISMYKSYKRVRLLPHKPYVLTDRDDKSEKALKYYDSLNSLGVYVLRDKAKEVITDPPTTQTPPQGKPEESDPPENLTPGEHTDPEGEVIDLEVGTDAPADQFNDSNPEDSVDNPEASLEEEPEVPTESEVPSEVAHVEDTPSQVSDTPDQSTEVTDAPVSVSLKSDLDSSELEAMTEGELAEFIDMNYSDLTALIEATEYHKGRLSRRDSIISDMVSKKRSEIIQVISK